MPDHFKRPETTHINEQSRTATGTVQWYLEHAHKAGTHPITHNNRLKVFMCGEESFADIARQIEAAKESIDICCWGFDPGMELVRTQGRTWPRGKTYGDLLIHAGKRGVKVRLLVWYDKYAVGPANQHNMPGYTHDANPWRADHIWTPAAAAELDANHSLMIAQAYHDEPLTFSKVRPGMAAPIQRGAMPVTQEMIVKKAREEYCASWYKAAFKGLLKGIEIRTRCGDADAVATCLGKESPRLDKTTLERNAMVRGATHHQKPVLIDFFHQEGASAVGYVMGLNSLTDYWDTNGHELEDVRREVGGEKAAKESVQGKEYDKGFRTLKPYHDYACRVEGRALVALYNNFVKAWERAAGDNKNKKSELGSSGMPTALLRRAQPGDSTVQIVRTQPEEDDTTIRDISYQALDMATLACRYLYVENQYFQSEEWAQRLMEKRKNFIAGWKAGCRKAGKSMRDMPVMYVFVVTPVPEREGMIPRTYDALATLGQQGGMTGQNEMIDEGNKSTAVNWTPAWRDVLQKANSIEKPDALRLEDVFGLKVCTAMLNTCGFENRRWRYREIYIHSKLTLVDDGFMMIGSANLNLRSMAVDSEINLATNDPAVARELRKRIWAQHANPRADGGEGTKAEIKKAFLDWVDLMKENKTKQLEHSQSAIRKKMNGFLLPLEDGRSSFVRLG